MRDRIFFIVTHFRISFFKTIRNEDRVITETIISTAFGNDFTFHYPHKTVPRAKIRRQGYYRYARNVGIIEFILLIARIRKR